jgi:putative flippase GtrA
VSRRFRQVLAVGLVIGALDAALFISGVSLGMSVLVANLLALMAASATSFVAHRAIATSHDEFARISQEPLAFVRVAWPSALVDLALVVVLGSATDNIWALLAIKMLAILSAAVVRLATYRRTLFVSVRDKQARAQDRPELVTGPRLSVVLPAYRAEGLVARAISSTRSALDEIGAADLEIVVVDDGSPDGTADAARNAGADQVVVLEQNQGKGAAVRAGMLAATGRTVVFTDVDLAYPPHQILDLLFVVEAGADVAVGNRRHPDSESVSGAGRLRDLGSSVFNLMTYLVLLGSYRDTQCGLKAFRRDIGRLVFSQSRLDGFAFDVEILHIVERHHVTLVEVPVRLVSEDTSTVSLFKAAIEMMRDVVNVRRWAGRGVYDLAPDRTLNEELSDLERQSP